jgi:hypothetical protein
MRVRFANAAFALLVLGILGWTAAAAAAGQERIRRFQRRAAPAGDVDFTVFNVPYDGRFAFVRLSFTPDWTGWGGGGGFFGGVNYQWDHDYPRAERHFTTMLRELTATDAIADGSNILALDDPELFRYPVAYMSEPGHWTMTAEEADALRAYLLKGGFIIFDDFQGQHWFNFQDQIRRVLPDHRLVQLDASHPIFHSFFEIETLENFVHPLSFIPSTFFGIYEDNDPDKRLLLIANYNNDVGESWEWSDRDFIPIDLTNEAYKLGINYIVYALAH